MFGKVIVSYIKSQSKHHNGSASKALQKFFEFVNPRRVYLSVRSDNEIEQRNFISKII